MKPPTHKHRTATEKTPWNSQQGNYCELKPYTSLGAASNYKHMFGRKGSTTWSAKHHSATKLNRSDWPFQGGISVVCSLIMFVLFLMKYYSVLPFDAILVCLTDRSKAVYLLYVLSVCSSYFWWSTLLCCRLMPSLYIWLTVPKRYFSCILSSFVSSFFDQTIFGVAIWCHWTLIRCLVMALFRDCTLSWV